LIIELLLIEKGDCYLSGRAGNGTPVFILAISILLEILDGKAVVYAVVLLQSLDNKKLLPLLGEQLRS
jgi:hypothetical protein